MDACDRCTWKLHAYFFLHVGTVLPWVRNHDEDRHSHYVTYPKIGCMSKW